MVRERGIPERINRNSLGARVEGGAWATPRCRRVVSSSAFRFVPALPLPGGKDEQDLGRNMVGGRSLRSWIEGVFAAWCANGYLFPPGGVPN